MMPEVRNPDYVTYWWSDLWYRVSEALPHLLLFGVILFVVWLGYRQWNQYAKRVAGAFQAVNKDMKELNGRVENLENWTRDYKEYRDRFLRLAGEFHKMKQEQERQDPLSTIVEEQRTLSRTDDEDF